MSGINTIPKPNQGTKALQSSVHPECFECIFSHRLSATFKKHLRRDRKKYKELFNRTHTVVYACELKLVFMCPVTNVTILIFSLWCLLSSQLQNILNCIYLQYQLEFILVTRK
ncbi:hypothetical protein EK904_002523 [Melospiza melodia maxima]|nr:hypothetical protein EK904_002523 [Melospiza melodia maxima]